MEIVVSAVIPGHVHVQSTFLHQSIHFRVCACVPSKMDVCFRSSCESEGFSFLKGEIGKKIEKIFGQLDKTNHKDVAKEVSSCFTKSSLLDIRQKMFNSAVAKEAKKRPLTTAKTDAATFETVDRPDQFEQDPLQWRLVNRSSKPKIVNDVMSLPLHVKYPRDAFPVHILKPEEKRKVEVNKSTIVSRNPSIADDWADESSSEEKEESDNQSEAETSQTNEKGEGQRNIDTSVETPNVPVAKVKSRDSDTSTIDLIHTRSIATQTCDVDRDRAIKLAAENRPETGENQSDKPESIAKTTSQSVSSLLDYINAEYETVKNNGIDMNTTSRKRAAPASCDKRMSEMESKYDAVVKRVVRLEKAHDDDIRGLRAEMDRKLDRMHGTPNRNAERRHSDSEVMSQIPPHDISSSSSDSVDESVWELDACNVMVNTQDSQGNQVSTRATPMHMREMAARNKTRQCDCAHRDVDASVSKPDVAITHQSPGRRNTRQTSNRKKETDKAETMIRVGSNNPAPNRYNKTSSSQIQNQRSEPDRNNIEPEVNNAPIRPSGIAASRKYTNKKKKEEQPVYEKPGTFNRRNNASDVQEQQSVNACACADQKPKQSNDTAATTHPEDCSDDNDDAKRRKLDNQDSCQPSTSGYHAPKRDAKETCDGKSRNTHDEYSSGNESRGKKSYAKVVTKDGWTKVLGSQNSDNGNAREFPPIR